MREGKALDSPLKAKNKSWKKKKRGVVGHSEYGYYGELGVVRPEVYRNGFE